MDRRTFIAASTAVVTCGSLLADEEKQVRVYYGTKNQSGSEANLYWYHESRHRRAFQSSTGSQS